MDWIFDTQAWFALITLTALEIVLGIDNIIMLTILVGRLPRQQRGTARLLGISFAMLTRIALLFSLFWIMKLTAPLFEIMGKTISARDILLMLGGLFLIAKSTHELHVQTEANQTTSQEEPHTTKFGFFSIIVQIGLLDIIFSLDSVMTAVGLVKQLPIMVTAIILSMLIMVAAAKAIGEYIEKHPTLKVLALSFLILIGVVLIGEALGLEIPKGYIYFAMAYSVGIEMLNIKIRKASSSSKT